MNDPVPDSGEKYVLAFDGVSHQFGSVTVLEDISLEVKSGSLVAVIGPNGSGKTTLLRIATGLLSPSSGTVNRPEEGIRPVGYLPQDPGIRASMTVRETIEFYARLGNESTEVEAVLETTGLEEISDRRVDALSGGMHQLLGLGLATLYDPSLVVLDEPAGSLDPRNSEHIFSVAAELTTNGTGVLVSTHKLEYVQKADNILLLDDGEILIQMSPEELLDRTTEDSIADAFHSILGTGPTVQTGHEKET